MRANWALIELLQKVGARYKANPGQVNLAWQLAKKPFIIPIPGTTQIAHLKENMEAANLPLTPADIQEIDAGLAEIVIVGKRAADDVLRLLDIGEQGDVKSKGTHGLSPLPKNNE